MNSSDQNVIPLDTAFERRWESVWIIDTKQDIDSLYIKGAKNFFMLKNEIKKLIKPAIFAISFE